MQVAMTAAFLAVLLGGALSTASAVDVAVHTSVNPVQKVLELLSGLQTTVIDEGTKSKKVYDEFAEWCEDSSRNLRNAIKSSQAQVADSKATIEKASDDSESLGAKIDALSSAISTDTADLKAANMIATQETAVFEKEEKSLMETTDTLERGIAVLEKEMKSGASLLQAAPGAGGLAQALSVVVEASGLGAADAARLTSLVQSGTDGSDSQGDGDFGAAADEALGAPDAAAYQSQSGSIVETLSGLLEKAEAQLEASRKARGESTRNYALMKQSLEDKIKFAEKELKATKTAKSEAEQKKASVEGDLSVTKKSLSSDVQDLGELHRNCMGKAADFEEETKSRDEELQAIATAKKVISEKTGGAEKQSYGLSQVSFLQVRKSMGAGVPADIRVVRWLKRLAGRTNSAALTQLSARLDSTVRSATFSGEDPFAKVKGLISDMLSRLQQEADSEATQKAYCDKEMAETESKQDDKEAEFEKLTSKIDQMTAEAAKLSAEMSTIQEQLANMAREQRDMAQIRQEEKALFLKNKPELEEGIQGCQMALKILREYYGSSDEDYAKAEGAGQSIIGLLEVVESDFTKGLSQQTAEEEAAAASYDTQVKEAEITRATKEQDLKYKGKEAKSLSKASSELSSDRDGVGEELAAVKEYFSKLKQQCVAKAEPYEERARRRAKEIDGLKQALQTLEGDASLLQEHSQRRRLLRGGDVA